MFRNKTCYELLWIKNKRFIDYFYFPTSNVSFAPTNLDRTYTWGAPTSSWTHKFAIVLSGTRGFLLYSLPGLQFPFKLLCGWFCASLFVWMDGSSTVASTMLEVHTISQITIPQWSPVRRQSSLRLLGLQAAFILKPLYTIIMVKGW